MHLSSSRQVDGIRDALLAFAAFAASTVPFLRELSDARRYIFCGPANHALVPVALTDEAFAVSAKLALTVAILTLAAFVARFSTRGRFSSALAALPLVRSAVLIGALTAVSLTAFDVCTAFHGASTDAAGSCHCWLTGLLAAVGALFTIGSASAARAIRDAILDLRRALDVFFVWLERKLALDRRQGRVGCDRLTIVEFLFASQFGGRAPPFA
jgi:hypothetical protein